LADKLGYTNASTLAPTIYAQAIYAALIGYFIFNTIPPFWAVIGTIIIIMSGVYIWLRDPSFISISCGKYLSITTNFWLIPCSV
jgi:drug/metabolite transporter (DMT)-like permease